MVDFQVKDIEVRIFHVKTSKNGFNLIAITAAVTIEIKYSDVIFCDMVFELDGFFWDSCPSLTGFF